jgi:hypothetical protein
MLRTTLRYDNARVIASTINEMPCSLLGQLADYLMGSEEEQVRLNGEIQAVQAVAAANSVVLLEAKTEARRQADSLQEILEERTRSAERAEHYARSLEAALAEHREILEERTSSAKDAEQYARSLEASLVELQEALKVATEYAAGLERSRAEMEAYTKSLEAELGKRTEEK